MAGGEGRYGNGLPEARYTAIKNYVLDGIGRGDFF